MIPAFRRSSLVVAAALFVVLLAIYGLTACRTVGPGDSGELTVVLSTWSVAHPPGFPLLSLLGNLVSSLPHPGEPAFILNLLSALLGALACAALVLAVAVMSGSAGAGFVAGLALGVSPIFWRYCLVIEVFSLNAFLASLLLLFLAVFLRRLQEKRPVLWPLPASALIMSAVVTHQPTLVLIAGPLLLTYIALVPSLVRAGIERHRLRRAVLASVACAAAGLLPLFYLPLAARLDPPLNWGNVRDLSGFTRFFLRSDFGTGTLIAPAITVHQVLEHGESASPLGFRHYRLFWASIPDGFGWPFTLSILAGAVWAVLRARPLALILLLFLAALTLFFARVNTPVVPLYVGISQAFYLLPQLVLALFGGLGLAALLGWSVRFHPRAPVAIAAIVAIATAAILPARWREFDMSRNTFTRDFGANLMAGMPEGALVLSDGDLFRNSFHYQQACLGRRPDLTLVEQNMMLLEWYVEQLRRRRALRLPEGMTALRGDAATGSRAWLDLNLDSPDTAANRPVAAVRLIDDTHAGTYRLVPMGLWHRVLPRAHPVDLASWAGTFSSTVRSWNLQSLGERHAATSWETSETIFYVYALAKLRAVREAAGASGGAGAAGGATPGIVDTLFTTGPRRADDLAYQAEFWWLALTDSLTAPARPPDSAWAGRAMALARSALAIEPENIQALQIVAALLHGVPRYRDPGAELAIRHRIVRLRPGDRAELVPYFDLVGRIPRDPTAAQTQMLRESERVHRRFLDLLGICMKLSSDPRLAALHAQWLPGAPGVPNAVR
jgi:hypothetical protein